MSYTDPTKPPVERPRVEPEIIPPNARRGGGGFENLFVRVEEGDDGFRRVQIKKIGPFTLAMILLGVGLAVGIVFLLLAGLVGMTVSLAAVGASFAFFSTEAAGDTGVSVAGVFTLVALVVFIASFAFSLGPIVWTIISEIYPNRVRGRAVSFATAVNWGAAFLVTQFFLTIVDAIGEAATFFSMAGICVLSYIWIHRNVPETRGRTLEEIQDLWNPSTTPAPGTPRTDP